MKIIVLGPKFNDCKGNCFYILNTSFIKIAVDDTNDRDANEYMKDHIFELRRKILIYD